MTTVDLKDFKPAEPNYEPSLPLELRVRESNGAAREDVAELAVGSSGTFVDNGTDRWHFLVVPGTPNVLTLQLQVADNITWWKQIQVAASFFGSWYNIRTLETKNDKRVATVDLTPADAQSGTLKLDFWKGGFLGLGAQIITLLLDVPSNLGNKVIYLCDRPVDINN
jgi:hypothetical protein